MSVLDINDVTLENPCRSFAREDFASQNIWRVVIAPVALVIAAL